MQILQSLKARSFVLMSLLLVSTSTSACAQEKPKRMIPGPSEFVVVPESLGENEDGIAQVTFGGISPPFKPTEYTYLGAKGLKDAPPLPTGYTLFKDLVFRVKTEALVSGSYLTVFRIASANNEVEFGKLAVLHLKHDELSPTDFSWEDASVTPDGWDEHFHHIPKRVYDAAVPDFQSKRIAGITDEFGIFAVAFAPESEPERAEPFPKVTVKATSSPEPVQAGQEVIHTITFTNEGTSLAAEINVKEVLDIYLDYISATPTQGVCKQKVAANNIVCHLGALPGGASATITIVSRTRPTLIVNDVMKASSDFEAVFKQNAADFVGERGQIQMRQVTSTIVKKP